MIHLRKQLSHIQIIQHSEYLKKNREYYPEGFEITWKELSIEVEKLIKLYKASNFGIGNRVAILFNQRPEFFFIT